MAHIYAPPRHILEVLQKIEYEEALQAGDPRYVDTQRARGSEKTFARLARKFGWDPASDAFFPPADKHVLFFGHIGSGKTTELRQYARQLDDSRRYYVVEVDVLSKLDRNNLQYTEVLMAMAETLLEKMQADAYTIADDTLEPIRQWFGSSSITRSQTSELAAELQTGLSAGAGIAGLAKVFARFTASFKTGDSKKSEWRVEIRNRFTSLATAFSRLIQAAESMLSQSGRAQRILFLIDGTDKMSGEDTLQFFLYDAEQLLAIRTLAIYTAPLQLKYDGRLGGKLDADLVLPMIKLFEAGGQRHDPGWAALRDILLRRADRSLFADDATVDRLVEFSGGHPRELLRLLRLACEVAEGTIDRRVVDGAIRQLASDYARFLKPEDYDLLRAIDAANVNVGNDQRAQELLHRLALLEYNDGSWRRPHPVVRTLPGFAARPANDMAPRA